MADVLGIGRGNQGSVLQITAVPDSTFVTEINALITAGTDVVGKLVTLTFSDNYEVTSAADGAIPDGKITGFRKTMNAAGASYILDVDLFHYTDQNSSSHTPVCIQNLPYNDGTIALRDSVIIYGSTYVYVDDGGTGGWGTVIAKFTDDTTVDVLF